MESLIEPAARLIAVPRRRTSSTSSAWLLVVILAVVAAAAVGYMVLALRSARQALAGAQADTSAVRARLVSADARIADAEKARSGERDALDKELAAVRAQLAVTADKAREADALADKLKRATVAAEGAVTRDGDRLTLELVDKVLFSSAKAELTPAGLKMLTAVGKILREFPDKQVWVQGHTDDKPIATAEFRSNWELSTTRALNVVHFLQDSGGVAPERLAAVGFSKFRPISKKRARNRRIEIVLFPAQVTLKK